MTASPLPPHHSQCALALPGENRKLKDSQQSLWAPPHLHPVMLEGWQEELHLRRETANSKAQAHALVWPDTLPPWTKKKPSCFSCEAAKVCLLACALLQMRLIQYCLYFVCVKHWLPKSQKAPRGLCYLLVDYWMELSFVKRDRNHLSKGRSPSVQTCERNSAFNVGLS